MIRKIDESTLFDALKRGVCVVDIRVKNSFKAAHLKESVNLQAAEEIVKFAKEKSEIYLVCFAGTRSVEMAQKVEKLGFCGEIFCLDCGFMRLDTEKFAEFLA